MKDGRAFSSQQGEAVCIPRRGAGGQGPEEEVAEQGGGSSGWLSMTGVTEVELVRGLEGQVQRAHGALPTMPRSLDIVLSGSHDRESHKALTREGIPDYLG